LAAGSPKTPAQPRWFSHAAALSTDWGEAVTHFILIVAVELTAQECGDVVGFDGVNGGSGEIVVNGGQIGLPLEDE
jgi:hypothetical protein